MPVPFPVFRFPRWSMAGLPSILFCVGAAACGPFTGPSESPLRAETVTQQDPQGCRKVQFTIVGDTAVTGVYPDTACGMQLELVAAGAMGWSGDTLTIPFRLRNRSASSVLLPVRLEVRDSGIVALDPEEVPTANVVPIGMDSTLSGGRKLWLVGGSGALAAGDSTGVEPLLVRVLSPVTEAEFAFELVGHEGFEVALVPPNFTPTWFKHDSSHISGTDLKRVLAVRFHATATLQDRLTAIAVVNGTVIGGMHTGAIEEETYFIGIPGAVSFEGLRAASDSLANQSGVRYAVVMSRIGAHSRRPADGSGLTPNDWHFAPDQSGGWNWAAEELALPLAWGCELGSVQSKIGILDFSFSGGDYAANAPGGFPSIASTLHPDHGNAVASILAAVGNNNTGMAGVVWNSSLVLRAVGDEEHAVRAEEGLASMINAGVRVISISLGTRYNQDSVQMAERAEAWVHAIGMALEDIPTSSRPLLVVSAGNDNQNARLSGPPMLKEFGGGQWDSIMVVVAASGERTDSVRGRWGGASFARDSSGGSNHGSLIDVYAPGQNVNVRTSGTGSFSTVTGTSFAAPHIAGIAALLFSFDPTLTAAEVKQLILEGAINGGRRITNDSTRYLANAYESLKLAAQKSGTPICGFPVTIGVSSGDQVVKLRRPGNEETVALTSGTHTVAHHSLSVAPGGRAFSVSRFDQPSYSIELVYRYTLQSNGSWSASSPLDLLQQIYLEEDTVDVAWAVGNNGRGTGVTIRGPNGRAVGVLEDRIDDLPDMSTLVDWISPSLDGEYLVVGADVYADCWQDHGTWVIRLGNSTVERFVESECDWENWVYPRIGVGAAWSPYSDRFVLAEVENFHPWDWDEHATPSLAFRARSPTAVHTPIGTDQVISNRMAYGHGRWYADPDFSFPGMGRTDPTGLLMHWVEGTGGGCSRTVRSTVSPFTLISDTTMTFGITCVVQQVPLAPPIALEAQGPPGRRSAGREASRPTPREGSALGRRAAGVGR